jgi:hypothetical protein
MSDGAAHDAVTGSHLAGHELVDALDGTLDPRRLAHAAGCHTCAEQVEELHAIASDVAAVDVPEPPAFFWSQLSARVRAAVAEEPLPAPGSLVWRRWGHPALAIAAAVAIVGTIASLTGLWPSNSGTSEPPPAVALQTHDDVEPGEDVFAQIDNDEAWALVRTLAEDLDHDELEGEGVSARRGAADHLASELTAAERIELARLLQEQLKHQASDSAS